MLAMLLVATALLSSSVHSGETNEDLFNLQAQHIAKLFNEDDMTPDFTEQLGRDDRMTNIREQKDVTQVDKYEQPQKDVSTNTGTTEKTTTENPTKQPVPRNIQLDNGKGLPRNVIREDVIDVVDREDHVTQYLSDHLVNTDSEITSLQASETEDERVETVSGEVKEDAFFAFLTGLEKAVEVEGVWSRPSDVDYTNDGDVQKVPEQKSNAVSEVEYKD